MQAPTGPTDPRAAVQEETASLGGWAQWPRCARCGQRRLTVCPTCGTAGDQWEPADYAGPAEPLRRSRGEADAPCMPTSDDPAAAQHAQEILLACPQCDEVCAPRFYRHCARCGQDAGEGIEVASLDTEPLSPGTLIVLGTLIGLAVATWLYFRWLFG